LIAEVMEWNEITGFVVLRVVGLFVSAKFSEWRKNYFRNDSWMNRKKFNKNGTRSILLCFIYV